MGRGWDRPPGVTRSGAPTLDRRRLLRRAAQAAMSLSLLGVGLKAYAVASESSHPAGSTVDQAATPGSAKTCQATPGASPAASPAASPEAAVTIQMTDQLRFDPPEVTIAAGETVTWVNDSASPHTATGDPEQNPLNATRPDLVRLPDGAEPWGSELLQAGDTYAHTFTVPGRYEYICIPHVLSDMRGVIVVEC